MDFDSTRIDMVENDSGQILVGLDDMLVLLKSRARQWFADDKNFLEKFVHVVEETTSTLKQAYQNEDEDDEEG